MDSLNTNNLLSDTEFFNDIDNNLAKNIKMGSILLPNSSSSNNNSSNIASSNNSSNNNGNSNNNNNNNAGNNSNNNNHNNNNNNNNNNNPLLNSMLFNNPFDIEHMPLTNPPIYEPDVVTGITRRRVSISNGQIGQLIDLHGLYDSDEQSPDYSSSEHNKSSGSNNVTPTTTNDFMNSSTQQNSNNNYLNMNIQQQVMQHHNMMNGIVPPQQQQQQQQQQQRQQQQLLSPQVTAFPIQQRHHHSGMPSQFAHASQQHTDPAHAPLIGFVPGVPTQSTHNSSAHPTFQQIPSGVPPPQQLAMQQQLMSPTGNPILFKPTTSPALSSIDKQLIPGTEAWKKARLLERNRRAATKCRQKKKMAQQQMQKESEAIAKENEQLKKKVENLEATVGKLKDVLKDHASKCSNLADSIELLDGFLRNE